MTSIEDGRFSAVFGKPYDQMTQTELRAFTANIVPRCFTASGPLADLGTNEKSAVHRALNVNAFSMNARALAQSRGAADQA